MTQFYTPDASRYGKSDFYRRCGSSGLQLPALSLGLWHNFGDTTSHETSRSLILKAFDLGITHFDLANNYGPPPGAAERVFGRVLREDLRPWRDELIVTTKAGYVMWDGPYGNWGSRKHLMTSLDQSLRRMGMEYVDIFYHHRPDPNTPLEESMLALEAIVRSGKALYVGLSNYSAEQTEAAAAMLAELKTPCIVHQPRYHMFERTLEQKLLATLARHGMGSVVFCPLAQGLLTGKYLQGIPEDSRVAKNSPFLKANDLTVAKLRKIRELNALAQQRGQSLAQMALRWVVRHPGVTSAIIGASRPSQIEENVKAFESPPLSDVELDRIETILSTADEE